MFSFFSRGSTEHAEIDEASTPERTQSSFFRRDGSNGADAPDRAATHEASAPELSRFSLFRRDSPASSTTAGHPNHPIREASAPDLTQPASCDVLLFNTQDLRRPSRSLDVLDVTLTRDSTSQPFGVVVKHCGDCGLHVDSIISGSVADKDGRIRPGDTLLRLNDVSVQHWTPKDLAHGLQGLACKFLLRRASDGDCSGSLMRRGSGLRTDSLDLLGALSFDDGRVHSSAGLPALSEGSFPEGTDGEDGFAGLEHFEPGGGPTLALRQSRLASDASRASADTVDSDTIGPARTKHVIMRTQPDQPLGFVIHRGKIASVKPDSLAAAAGVEPGRRIVQIGSEVFPLGTSDREIARILRSKRGVFSIVTEDTEPHDLEEI